LKEEIGMQRRNWKEYNDGLVKREERFIFLWISPGEGINFLWMVILN